MIISNENYYVKRLPENPVNRYKWLYIDSSDGNIKISGNKWYLNLRFYMIQNLHLPNNVFNLDLSTQFTDVKDMTINSVSIEHMPDWVIQKEYCEAYRLSFILDTNDSKFFDQLLTNYKIKMTFNMNVDVDVLNQAKLELDQDDYNDFINECSEQTVSFDFTYSNYEEASSDSNKINIPSSYYVNSVIGSYSNDEIVFYTLNNDVTEIDEPIKRMLTINFEKDYIIEQLKVHFVYEVFGKKQQETTYEVNTPSYGSKSVDFNYAYCTYFDDTEGIINNQVNGIDGFYSPIACIGYYEIVLKINYNNVSKTFKFINPFSFRGNDDYQNKNLLVSQSFINNLDYFTKVSF